MLGFTIILNEPQSSPASFTREKSIKAEIEEKSKTMGDLQHNDGGCKRIV
jgi:hypothetical protein